MYSEVYRWFTETSGMGRMEQAATLMHPNQAICEEDISEAIEVWLEKANRLGRHGVEYQLPDSFNMVALKKIPVGKVRAEPTEPCSPILIREGGAAGGIQLGARAAEVT